MRLTTHDHQTEKKLESGITIEQNRDNIRIKGNIMTKQNSVRAGKRRDKSQEIPESKLPFM